MSMSTTKHTKDMRRIINY